MHDRSSIHTFGPPGAKFCFYLPTPPIFPDDWHYSNPDAVSQLIELNGNHWRKILTIMAKITAPDDNWKHYRDAQLLKQDEQILVGASQLSIQADWHFIVGGISLQGLESELQEKTFIALDESGKLLCDDGKLFRVPYLDYRQYPNKLIALTRDNLYRTA